MGNKDNFYADIMAFNSEVTASGHLVNIKFPDGKHVEFLVDFGLFQEKWNSSLNSKLDFNPEKIAFSIITHNHVDHTGRFAFAVKQGLSTPIYTNVQNESYLLKPAIEDSCAVITVNAKHNHQKPLYDEKDIENFMKLLVGVEFGQTFKPCPNIEVTLFANAHEPGAALVLVSAFADDGKSINILFTGDYNVKNMFFDVPELPTWVKELPLTIVQESTYGTTDRTTVVPRFVKTISEKAAQNKPILLLAYSFGRTQEILYTLKCMQKSGMISPNIPIYLDGKLGTKYTKLYHLLDVKEEMKDFLPENLTFVTKNNRANILLNQQPKIIITSSGNGSYGPAQFYLPQVLPMSNAYIGFTGYTPEGTFGYKLQSVPQGEKVKCGGSMISRNAEVDCFTEFSAHAKADELIAFLKQFENIRMVLVNHGEPEKKVIYARRVEKEFPKVAVAILSREIFYRINPYGFVKSVNTKF